jgi:hypothetical protein
MNSLELVKAAIYFNRPERVPVFNLLRGDVLPLIMNFSENWRPGLGENEEDLFPHVRGYYNWHRPDWASNKPEYEGDNWRKIPHQEIDNWGCIWNMSGQNDNMGHPGRPSLPNWENYDEYISKYTPNPDDKSVYSRGLILKEKLDNFKYRAVIFNCVGPFQLAANMRGFSNLLTDHRNHPQELKRLLEHITEYFVKCMKMSFKYGLEPHGFFLYDDLGEQNGPYINPRIFEKFYEPAYSVMIEEAHDLGCEFHLHCCGRVAKLIPYLMKWGVDAVEFDSPRMCGYKELSPYRGKIMMWGCINIQSIYTRGTQEECEREVWHMIRNLGTRDGGFGAYFYPQVGDIQVPHENIQAFHRGLKKYGTYSKVIESWWNYPTVEEWKDDAVPPLPPIEA